MKSPIVVYYLSGGVPGQEKYSTGMVHGPKVRRASLNLEPNGQYARTAKEALRKLKKK